MTYLYDTSYSENYLEHNEHGTLLVYMEHLSKN